MLFSNTNFVVKYVDPSSADNGDGTDPATPLNVLPASAGDIENATCFLIRRTAEENAVQLPQGSNADITHLMFLGMPKESDPMWQFVPPEARAAWGADAAEYANLKADTGSEPYGDSVKSLQLDQAKCFVLYRANVFRDNTPAYASIFKFPNQNYEASLIFEYCRFGAKGVDIDKENYTEQTSTSSAKSYIEAKFPKVFSLKHCIVNMVSSSDYYGGYGHAIYLENAHFITANDIQVFATSSQYGGDSGPSGGIPLCLTNGSGEDAFGHYENITCNILINGTWGYLPGLFYSAKNQYCLLKKFRVNILDRKLGTETPGILRVGQSMIRCLSNHEYRIEDIDIKLPKCWRIESNGHICSISGFSNITTPGYCKSVKNISIQMAETDGVDNEGNGLYYDQAKYGTDNCGRYNYYSALELSFSERSYSEGSWEPVMVSGITVNHPHGVALYCFGAQLHNCEIKGSVKLRRVTGDISTVETFYPGYAICAAEGTTLRVHQLTLGKANAATVGSADDPAIGSNYSDSSFIYVDVSNGALKSNQCSTATDVWNGYNCVCANESDSGHYTCRSNNYITDTWNVHRTGGAPACLKLYNNSADGSGFLSLGRAPFTGIRLTAEKAGMHNLILYAAVKGMSDFDQLSRKLLIQATVTHADGTEETYFSSIAGQWQEDVESVWNNDSELQQIKLVMPIAVEQASNVDVKIHFSWYSATGFVYLDPAIQLLPVVSE